LKILVTGGAGFIGGRLVRRLKALKHDVLALDLRQDETGEVHLADVRESDEVAAALGSLDGADVVFHLAGPVVEMVRKNLQAGLDLQLRGTLAVLEACREHPRPRPKVILASSFYVYADGSPAEAVVNEATSLDLLNLEPFGAAKLMAERVVRAYSETYGLRYVNLRFGSAYGYGDCSNVIKSFLETGRRGDVLELWGQGRRQNQYTYVDDIVEGCVLALELEDTTINLISETETTTGELALMLREMYGFEVVFDTQKAEGSSMPRMVSLSRRRGLSWSSRPLTEGIKATVAEMAQAASAPS